MSFVTIVDPDKPNDYLVLAKRDYDPAVHTLVAAPSPDVPPAGAEGAAAPAAAPATPPVPSTAPSSIADLTVEHAQPVIAAADAAQLAELRTQEEARTPPRVGILKAISTRLATLG